MSKESTGAFISQSNLTQATTTSPTDILSNHVQYAESGLPSSSWSASPQPSSGLPKPCEVTFPPKSLETKRTSEELECINETVARFHERLVHDHRGVSHPDVDSPFTDQLDVINRLLPYHIFQQPAEDLETLITGKGKEKAIDNIYREELQGTRFALECYKRHAAIRDRWRKLKIRSGKRPAPDDQAYYIAQVVLESDRSENAWLGNELRNARAESERLEREKRTAANAARMTQFSSVPQTAIPTMQPAYYRGYPYAYTQAYGSAATPTISTFPAAPAASTSYIPYQSTGAIPVQLPVASLPALHALGIVPVPAVSLSSEGQPPPAVLRGSSANGTILSLEINVSLLQSAQMSGLAMVLNSLVSRSNGTPVASTASTLQSVSAAKEADSSGVS